ncbi:MAG: hypothetical protein ACJ72N_27540 [Labedaea sp.]
MYHISVQKPGTDTEPTEYIADAHGDLEAIAYHVRRLELEDGTEYAAELKELSAIHGDEVQTLASITGDAEIVGIVLNRRLSSLRKARKAQATPAQ